MVPVPFERESFPIAQLLYRRAATLRAAESKHSIQVPRIVQIARFGARLAKKTMLQPSPLRGGEQKEWLFAPTRARCAPDSPSEVRTAVFPVHDGPPLVQRRIPLSLCFRETCCCSVSKTRAWRSASPRPKRHCTARGL